MADFSAGPNRRKGALSETGYGLTAKGPNIKRLDTILEDLHSGLSERWGVNTRQNPESLLNHMLTNIADRIAELWEFGEEVYYSQYPSTAEGASLDNAAQFGGSTRESAVRSYYPIHCTGKDGTKLAAGTLIASATNPVTQLSIKEAREITRASFNRARIKIASLEARDVYTVAINGAVFSYVSEAANTMTVLQGIAAAIGDKEFVATVDEKDEQLCIEAKDIASTNVLILSENLTTETVTSIITFGTVDTGNILIPDGVISNIVKADAGLLEVVNLCGYISGRDEESDIRFRQSYADKIFNRSSNMLESIRSAILNNVLGVRSVAPYENATHEWYVDGAYIDPRLSGNRLGTLCGRRTASRSWSMAETLRKLPGRSRTIKLVVSTPWAIQWSSCQAPTMKKYRSDSTGQRRCIPGSGWGSSSIRRRRYRPTMSICCGALFWRTWRP